MESYAKFVVNPVIASTLQPFNEGTSLATKASLDPEVLLHLILSSRARLGINH